jgi:phosphoribosylformylglycinamidine synthase
VTNCLNFGNPYDPEVYYQFVKAVQGMGEACRKFNTPVTGGNVSFYNQNPTGPVYPTPTIGMVGILDDINNKMSLDYKKAGDKIYLIGRPKNDIGSSEYLHKLHKVEFSNVPAFDLEEEYNLQQAVAALIKEKLVASAHDISEGGLMITLLEKGFNRNLGFDVSATTDIRQDAFWFGEAQSRVVVSVPAAAAEALEAALKVASVDFSLLGTVTDAAVTVDGHAWGDIREWKEKYDTAIEKMIAEN